MHNQLRKRKIKLIVILVGQKQLLGVKESFKASGARQILSRFMACSHYFSGLKNKTELKRFLTGYDENSEFPEGSGISYTQYFVPTAFNAGWRLSSQTNLIWECLDQLLASEGFKIRELPMQPLAILVYQLLKELAEIDEQKEIKVIDKGLVLECIQYSCMAQLLDYCSASDAG